MKENQKARKRNNNMLKLTELLHAIDEENKEGLINIDSGWRWPDVDHLITMGFKCMDDHHMQTDKPPKITIYKKKGQDDKGKETSYFYLEEPKKPVKRFKTFNDVIEFFDKYEQPGLSDNV